MSANDVEARMRAIHTCPTCRNEGFVGESCPTCDRRPRVAVAASAYVATLEDTNTALRCLRTSADYVAKARTTQDDGLADEYLALTQHALDVAIAALTAGAG